MVYGVICRAPLCHHHHAADFVANRLCVYPPAGRRQRLPTCGLSGRTGETRAELRCFGVHGGQIQGGGLGEGGWWQQLFWNQSQMNRDPSLIPRLCETQWQPRTLPINCNNPTLLLLDIILHMMTPCFSFRQIHQHTMHHTVSTSHATIWGNFLCRIMTHWTM